MLKKGLKLIVCILFLFTKNVLAQKNIIDVPTSEIIEEKKEFYQFQSTISDRQIKSSIIYTRGFSGDWEAGIFINQFTINLKPHSNIINIDPDEPEANPDLLIHFQKVFEFKKWYGLGLGTRF